MVLYTWLSLINGMLHVAFVFILCSKQYNTTLITPTLIMKMIWYTYLTKLATVLHKTFFLSYKGQLFNYKSI